MTTAAVAISRALLRVPNASTEIPRRLGIPRQVSTGWLNATSAPSADNLIALMSEFDTVFHEVMALAGKRPLTDAQLKAARDALKLLEAP